MEVNMSTMEKVQEIIAEALYLDAGDVAPESTLMGDLGAESIDFLDIVFRLEKSFGFKIPKGDIEKKARGGLKDEEFAVNGVIQPAGLLALRAAMPEVNPSLIKAGLNLRDIAGLFTVATFTRMVQEQLGEPTAFVTAPPLRVSQPAARL
jgi:acyl carrier protein